MIFSFEHEPHTLLERLLSLEAATAALAADQAVAAAADVHAVRAVFESEDPDRAGLVEALGKIRFGTEALLAVDDCAGRLQIHQSNATPTPLEIATIVHSIRRRPARRPWCSWTTCRGSPSRTTRVTRCRA
ncbi:MAG: hypothetical protein WBL35_16865 [Ornithinibacter sp.]